MKDLFTMEECMEQLGVSQRTIQNYLKTGILEKCYKKISKRRKRYITVESVAKFCIFHLSSALFPGIQST